METETSQLESLVDTLRGKVLRREENQFDGDYSGGSSFFERAQGLFLYRDGTYRYEERTFSRVSAGGMSLPSERRKAGAGTWTVQVVRQQPALVLWQDGSVVSWWHTRDGGPGVQYLDGEVWKRFLIP